MSLKYIILHHFIVHLCGNSIQSIFGFHVNFLRFAPNCSFYVFHVNSAIYVIVACSLVSFYLMFIDVFIVVKTGVDWLAGRTRLTGNWTTSWSILVKKFAFLKNHILSTKLSSNH